MKTFEGSHVLVVGGAGFIGSNLVKKLLRECSIIRITIVDNLLSADRCNIPDDDRVCFIEGSIANDQVLQILEDNIDYVFHLATFHGNQNSIFAPLQDHENNTLTTLKLFERLKDFCRLKKVVYSSAGCSVAKKTFDTAEATKELETVSLNMDSPYSMSKIFGEFYSKYYFKQHQLPVVRVRFQNVYGPGEVLGAGQWRGTIATIWRNVIPTFIYKSLDRQALPLENGGYASRDFIYVDDIVMGLICAALRGAVGDVYNLASGKETTILELATLINQLTNNDVPCQILPKRAWDTSGRRFGCTRKSEEVLGFKTKISMDEGLRHTVEWTKQNLYLIDSAINQHKTRTLIN